MKLVRIENYYVNPDTVAYVYGKSLGGSYSGKYVTVAGTAQRWTLNRFTGTRTSSGGKPRVREVVSHLARVELSMGVLR
jgi:hypothetical protein